MNKIKNIIVLASVFVISFIFLLVVEPVPQNPEYHLFSDDRRIFMVKNGLNVLTNIPFIIVGLMGIFRLLRKKDHLPYILFFTGVFLTGTASGYYHLSPSNHTLTWDRLAMVIAFMSFFSAFLNDFIHKGFGDYALFPLIGAGIFSVLYWHFTEQKGSGDLRAYILVQFLPILLIPVLMNIYESAYSRSKDIYKILCCYILAKIFEYYDKPVFEISGISGHSIKHLLCAFAAYMVLRMLMLRKKH